MYSIAAASILAKVTRDRIMCAYADQYPEYNLAQHKGYPTKAHFAALAKYGPSPIHRMSFAPVRDSVRTNTSTDASAPEAAQNDLEAAACAVGGEEEVDVTEGRTVESSRRRRKKSRTL